MSAEEGENWKKNTKISGEREAKEKNTFKMKSTEKHNFYLPFFCDRKDFRSFFRLALAAPLARPICAVAPLTICFSYIFHSFPSLKSSSSWATKNGSQRENKDKKEKRKKKFVELTVRRLGRQRWEWNEERWSEQKENKRKETFRPHSRAISLRDKTT